MEGVRVGQENEPENGQRAREIGYHVEIYPTTIRSVSIQPAARNNSFENLPNSKFGQSAEACRSKRYPMISR